MIILHENLPKEANRISGTLKSVYGFSSKLENRNLEAVFVPAPKLNGHFQSICSFRDFQEANFPNKKILIITPRDIYSDVTKNKDDWLLGYHSDDIMLVSTARIKRPDNSPSQTLRIPEAHYMKRLEFMAIHEIGHDVVKSDHMQEASWINTQLGQKLQLGLHCTDKKCVLYEIVDIKTPPATEGYMRLGNEKQAGAGLDEALERIYTDWLCGKCKEAIKIGKEYEHS